MSLINVWMMLSVSGTTVEGGVYILQQYVYPVSISY